MRLMQVGGRAQRANTPVKDQRGLPGLAMFDF